MCKVYVILTLFWLAQAVAHEKSVKSFLELIHLEENAIDSDQNGKKDIQIEKFSNDLPKTYSLDRNEDGKADEVVQFVLVGPTYGLENARAAPSIVKIDDNFDGFFETEEHYPIFITGEEEAVVKIYHDLDNDQFFEMMETHRFELNQINVEVRVDVQKKRNYEKIVDAYTYDALQGQSSPRPSVPRFLNLLAFTHTNSCQNIGGFSALTALETRARSFTTITSMANAPSGYSNTSYNVLVANSCTNIASIGEFDSLIGRTFEAGYTCLRDLLQQSEEMNYTTNTTRTHLQRMICVLSGKQGREGSSDGRVKLKCDWASSPELAATTISRSNANFPEINFRPSVIRNNMPSGGTVADPNSLMRILFHESIHLHGHAHGTSHEFCYPCGSCCFPEPGVSEELQARACRLCGNIDGIRPDTPNEVQEMAEVLNATGHVEIALRHVLGYLERTPRDENMVLFMGQLSGATALGQSIFNQLRESYTTTSDRRELFRRRSGQNVPSADERTVNARFTDRSSRLAQSLVAFNDSDIERAASFLQNFPRGEVTPVAGSNSVIVILHQLNNLLIKTFYDGLKTRVRRQLQNEIRTARNNHDAETLQRLQAIDNNL